VHGSCTTMWFPAIRVSVSAVGARLRQPLLRLTRGFFPNPCVPTPPPLSTGTQANAVPGCGPTRRQPLLRLIRGALNLNPRVPPPPCHTAQGTLSLGVAPPAAASWDKPLLHPALAQLEGAFRPAPLALPPPPPVPPPKLPPVPVFKRK
jgi:hypothetical protein